MSKDKVHRILGHIDQETTTTMTESLGWKLTDINYICSSHRIAKAKQKALSYASNHQKANCPGERIYVNLSKTRKPTELKSIGKQN